MEKAKIPLLILAILAIVYFVFRYLKTNSTPVDGSSTAATMVSKNGVLEKEKDKSIFDKIIDVVVPPAPKYSNKLGLTYEGQSLYGKYNGVNASTYPNAIGYLVDGTLIGTFNAEYRDGEYKKIVSSGGDGTDNDVILSSFIATLNVDGSSQKVYGRKTGVNLQDYSYSVGFLLNGLIVYQRVVNEGEPNEYSYYGT